MNYALIVNPHDIETPIEELSCHVYAKLDGYEGSILSTAKRMVDSHAPRGHGYLICPDEIVKRLAEGMQSGPAGASGSSPETATAGPPNRDPTVPLRSVSGEEGRR